MTYVARHATLVITQGEEFTWGEELGGQLGHGVSSDTSHPLVVESLTIVKLMLDDLSPTLPYNITLNSRTNFFSTWDD